MKNMVRFLLLALMLFSATAAHAATIKVFVSEFAVTGAPNKDELKSTLQTLLASRLTNESVLSVDSPVGADVVVKGSYIVFGKVFSIDAVAKDQGGKVLARAFQQGESQNDLIPALGKLGQSLAGDIAAKVTPGAPEPTVVRPIAAPAPTDVVRPEPSTPDIIRAQDQTRTASGGWMSQRLNGTLEGIAPGRILSNDSREYFIVGANSLRLYRKGDSLKLIAEVTFSPRERIISIDSADLDGDGTPEAYLTMMDGETLASQVWVVANETLKRIATKLPYYFRGIALDGKDYRIYAQQTSIGQDFFGDVYELVKKGDRFEIKNPIKLPRFGNIYNFSRFRDASGASYPVVINEDGYIIVYSAAGEELWRSSDKFGGTDTYFKKDDTANIRTTGDPYRWIFLQQRITVTPAGDIIVPQNGGLFVVGNMRSYKKNSVFSFVWNGSTLDEKWHTKQSQSYLSDYFYDHDRKELVILEVVKKEGLIDKGASTVVVKKVE